MNVDSINTVLLDSLLKAVPSGIYGLDAEAIGLFTLSKENKITDCNYIFITIAGFTTKKQITGMSLSALISANEDEIISAIDFIREEHGVSDVLQTTIKEKHCKICFNYDGEAVTGFVVDNVVERKLKNALSKLHYRVTSFIKTNDFIWVEDLEQKIIYCNQRIYDLIPVSPIGKTLLELYDMKSKSSDIFITSKDFTMNDYREIFLDDTDETAKKRHDFYLREIIMGEDSFIFFIVKTAVRKNKEVIGHHYRAKDVTRVLKNKTISIKRSKKIDRLMEILSDNTFIIDLEDGDKLIPKSNAPTSIINMLKPRDIKRIVTQCRESTSFGYIDTMYFTVETVTGDGIPLIVYVKPICDASDKREVTKLKGLMIDIYKEISSKYLLKTNIDKCNALTLNTSDILWSIDYKTEKMIDITISVERVLKYTKAEAMTKGPKILCPIAYRSLYSDEKMISRLLHDESVLIETRCFTKDGEPLDMEINITPVIYEGKIIELHGANRVITKRKELEASMIQTVMIHKEINKLMFELLKAGLDVDTDFINRIISRIGDAGLADRVYIFQINNQLGCFTQTHEWVRENELSQIKNPELECVYYQRPSDLAHTWHRKFEENEQVHVIVREEKSEELKSTLSKQNIKSLIAVAIPKSTRNKKYEKDYYGFVGFDECFDEKRIWTTYEIAALESCAMMLGQVFSTIEHKRSLTVKHVAIEEQLALLDLDSTTLSKNIQKTVTRLRQKRDENNDS